MNYSELKLVDTRFSVREIVLLSRAVNRVLHKTSDIRLSDVLQLQEEDVSCLKGCGKGTLLSIKKKMAEMGVSFGCFNTLPLKINYSKDERDLWADVVVSVLRASRNPAQKVEEAKLVADDILSYYHNKFNQYDR